jgi:steroid delta-isomerase-like uncharacterized protein
MPETKKTARVTRVATHSSEQKMDVNMSLDEHKKRVRAHIDRSWNRGYLAISQRLHSKDFTYKSSFTGSQPNSAGFSAPVLNIRSAVPDLEVVVEECIAEGHKVMTWCTLIGTIEKPARGYLPSDKVLIISAMVFWSLNLCGEIQEICTMFDMESFRAQQGLVIQSFEVKALP